MSGMLAAALWYARRGWLVFPLKPDKSPAFPSPHRDPAERAACKGTCGKVGHGFYDATADAERITRWWTARPSHLVAVRVPESMIMLDIDPRGGGLDTLARLERQHGRPPATLTCLSGRDDGGRHLYFRRPPGPLSGHRLPGVDLCHHGLRYAVLPPSPHPATGRPYTWADPDAEVAALPAWLAALLTPRQPDPPRASRGDRTGGGGGLAAWVAGLDSTPGTGRHDKVLWALVCAFREGATPQEIDAIKEAAVGVGKPQSEVDALEAWARASYGASAA